MNTIQYVTLHFIDPCSAASLCFRYHSEITVLMCKQKPYPVWFLCQYKSYLVLIVWTKPKSNGCKKRGQFFQYDRKSLTNSKWLLTLNSACRKVKKANQGPKLRLLGRQCDQKFSSGDQNFITGRQPATCKAGCHCKLSHSEKMIKNWNLEAICQQMSYFLSCWYLFNLKVKRIFL